jgi:ectoine hydroxylase-related dioxygenase (phytanoyl-CoA dioxygenase family)
MGALIAAHPELDPGYAPNLIEIDQSWLAYAPMPEILDAVEQLIGANIIVWGSALFCKKGRAGKPTFWHQDGTYWPMRPLAACSVWIAIDPSTRANGCLCIIPGSHKAGRVLAHES